jgi:hypothetical protein
VLRVDAGIDDQADRAPDVAFQAAVVVVGILVEADILAQPLGVEPPSLGVSGVVDVFAKFGNAGELLRDRYLQMMPGQPFVVSPRLYIIEGRVSNL